jgi:hypothetical protein
MKIIRGLSLTRPWPFAFVAQYGGEPKRVENRSWYPPDYIVGNYIALHAAKSWDEEDREYIADITGLYVPSKKESAHSEIFAVCRVRGYALNPGDVPANQRQWFFGPYGWLLDDYVQLDEPVPCVGARGLWGFEKKQDELAQLRLIYARSKAKAAS